VHLRAVKLRGFKSFPDPVEVRLEPGVGVIVGPNGSGKSNVSDAIRWAAGSLSPTELRAEKPDDVLFSGGGSRGPADFCEVELLFDNSDGALPVDYAELSVARRLHRGGEGQYLVNRAAVRRLDLVELLADLGLGQGMHSIISQGKVEAILASRPAERRALIEEAAGLGRFKARRHRAELKLARVALEVERARDVEAEVKKRLRPLALQATAAERAQKLAVEIARLRARMAQLDLVGLEEGLAELDARRSTAGAARSGVEERLEALLAERGRAEEELADAAGGREQALQVLYRLRSAAERLELRRESAEARVARLRDELVRPRRVLDDHVRAERAALADEIRLLEERLRTLDRALAEREGLPPAARALAEDGERIAFSLLEVEPGCERAVAAALGRSASAVVRDDATGALTLLERARDGGLGSLVVLVGREPAQLVAQIPVVSKEELLTSRVAAVTPEGFGYDPERGELWFAGETAEALLLELQARRRALASELDELRARLDTPIPDAAYSVDPNPFAERAVRLTERLLRALEVTVAHFETPLRTDVDAGAARSGELGAELRRLGAAEVELRQELTAASDAVSTVEVEAARLEAEADEARRRLEQAMLEARPAEPDSPGGQTAAPSAPPGDEPAEGDDREQLLATVERLERRRETLGQVNPLAHEEYEAEKVRLEELAAQRADLEASLEELEKLRSELTETVERRFTETFDAVQRHFADVAGTVFPGGEGRLRLADAEEDEEEPPAGAGGRALQPDDGGCADVASSQGVEVELRPAGKRVQRLSLLSGGEKALGAIAFLFALFLARPCPFYLLDEVEAALDDTNIGRFVELLRRYSDRAQFVVITHQKRTMEAADVLYGVTMGGEGVSQVVSRRLPREEAEAASAA
jgi:chromosome segregation protein